MPQSSHDAIPTGSIFVGRQREMAELKDALDNALAGNGQLVMLAGEPGISKIRTAQELASNAAARSAQVLWGWCYEQGGAPPYWPWIQPIRFHIQEKDTEELRSEMGSGAFDIAQIMPEIREQLTGLALSPTLEPEQARFRLFDPITNLLNQCGPIPTADAGVGGPSLGPSFFTYALGVCEPRDFHLKGHASGHLPRR